MNIDIVCAESELSMAANNIVEYADFLSRMLETYFSILSDIQDKGIQDDLVCSKLSSIYQSLKSYKESLPCECEEVASNVRNYISGISRADCFKFPTDITSTIASLVAQFL